MNIFRFIILNIFLSLNLQAIFLATIFGVFVVLCSDESFWILGVSFILLFLINYFLKIIIFPTIYILSENSNLKSLELWNKLINNKNYRKNTLIFACILDLVICFIYYLQFEEYGFFFQLISGGGVLTNYIAFLIWYKFYNSKYKKLFLNIYKRIIDVLIVSLLLLIILFNYTYHYAPSWRL